MKLLHKLITMPLLVLALAVAFTACDRDYDMPPLTKPSFTLPADAQTITIAQLRSKTAAATQDDPVTITDSLFLRARISGDDRSGNIYKTVYVQDETGGIPFLVDQSNVYNDYPAGQEVIISLKGLCVSVYGDELQIGHPAGYLYRTPYQDFKTHVHKNGWPDASEVAIKDFSNISRISDQTDANKFTLIRLTGVHFTDGGKANFAEASGYGTHDLVDRYGNSISVRTSNYAKFAAKKLPVGTGNVIGVLGRFRGQWQLTIRSIEDVYGFDGKEPSTTPGGGDPSTPTEKGYTLGEAVAPANIGEGLYAIGYTDGGTLYLMQHEPLSHYVATVAYTAGTTVDEKSVFTLAKKDGGFTIKGYNGKFVEGTVSGTYTNLVVSGSGNGHWTFSAPTEAGVEANATKAEYAGITTDKKWMVYTYYAAQDAHEFTMGFVGGDYATGYYKYPVFYKLVEK